MKAYIICFIVATLINLINEKLFFKKNCKIISFFLMILSLFCLSFVAGIRNLNVGTDVKVYVIRLYELACQYGNIFNYLKVCNSDLFFAILIYIGSLFRNINIVLFIIELAVCIPIYIYAYKERNNNSFTINILIFLLTMYCISFNLIRQSIAMSICILAYHYYNRDLKKKAIIALIIASLFHNTALIFLIAFIINTIIKSNSKNKNALIFFIVIGLVASTFFIDKIISITPYAKYLTISSSRDFSIGSIVKRLFWLILVLLSYKVGKNEEHKKNVEISFIFLIISILTTITSFSIPGTGRLGYYFFNMAHFIFIFEIPKLFKQKNFAMLGIIIILSMLWWKSTCVPNDSSRVYPYYTSIVKVLNTEG